MTIQREPASIACACLAAALWVCGIAGADAQSKAPLYAGKQIRIVIASGAGGGQDAYSRVFAAHVADHIPGRPSVVSENMPGANGLLAFNWSANIAPRDGTVILQSSNVVLSAPLFGDPAAKFDPRQFASLGSISKQQSVCTTWHANPIRTIDQARRQKVRVAASGAGSNSATLPLLLNAMLGTQFDVILGYSTGDMRLAVERGEVDGICGLSWSTLQASNPEWITNHRLNLLVQTGSTAQPGLRDVPLLIDLASDPRDKQVLKLLEFPGELGRPFLMPPGSPADMAEVLRTAFDATMKDPAFLADARKGGLEVDPVSGADMQRLIADAYATPKDLVARAAQLMGVANK